MSASRIGAAAAVVLSLVSTAAFAEDAAPVVAKKGEITIPIKIYGRRQLPAVAIDVRALVPRAPLPELRKPLVDRIGAAVEKAPF